MVALKVLSTIATVHISSRLDYCNSLYHNIAIKDILKLQRLQHVLPRVDTRSPRFSHTLQHCIGSLTFIFSGHTCKFAQLLSSNYNIIFVPSVEIKVGIRACSFAAPILWEYLHASVKSVGNIATIKTYQLKLAYPQWITSVLILLIINGTVYRLRTA